MNWTKRHTLLTDWFITVASTVFVACVMLIVYEPNVIDSCVETIAKIEPVDHTMAQCPQDTYIEIIPPDNIVVCRCRSKKRPRSEPDTTMQPFMGRGTDI